MVDPTGLAPVSLSVKVSMLLHTPWAQTTCGFCKQKSAPLKEALFSDTQLYGICHTDLMTVYRKKCRESNTF